MTEESPTRGAADLAAVVPDIDTLAVRLEATGYLASAPLATALFLAVRMGQPILLEGEPGVGPDVRPRRATAGRGDSPR